MKAINVIKKVKSHFKKQGIDIQIYPPRKGGNYKWTFQHGDYVGSFSANGHNGYGEGWEDACTLCMFVYSFWWFPAGWGLHQ